MSFADAWPWLGLLALGALHGINPGMGWLFAVALGLQEQKRLAVWRALLPLAGGHAAAIAFAVVATLLLGTFIPLTAMKWLVAAILLGFGVYRLLRNRHPRWGGMRVSSRDLAVWSFLMASAHGAGLMVVPLLLRLLGTQSSGAAVAHAAESHHHGHVAGEAATAAVLNGLPHGGPAGLSSELLGLLATIPHTAGYLLVTGAVAWVVYEKLGLRLLRSAWINVDLIWAATLIATALLTPWI